MKTMSPKERDAATKWAANQFKELTPDFFPCMHNSTKLLNWLNEQLGPEYGFSFPYCLEHFQAAWEHLNSIGTIFIQRPESDESKAERQRQVDAQNEADERLIQHAAEVQTWVDGQEKILKDMPLRDLRTMAVQQRDAIKKGEIERTSYRDAPASRVINVSGLAAARTRVMAKFPTMKTNSDDFNRLVQQELEN